MAKRHPRQTFWAPEEKLREIAQEQLNFGKNAFFSESNPQFFLHFWSVGTKT
tara:strand:- start:87 stop:242 length:156 start_codon:yes stop_codon:yes gene_type:complete